MNHEARLACDGMVRGNVRDVIVLWRWLNRVAVFVVRWASICGCLDWLAAAVGLLDLEAFLARRRWVV